MNGNRADDKNLLFVSRVIHLYTWEFGVSARLLMSVILFRVLLSLPTHIQMRRCDDIITFSPTIRILKTTIIGPFEGRFIPEEKFTISPRNGFLVKVDLQLLIIILLSFSSSVDLS